MRFDVIHSLFTVAHPVNQSREAGLTGELGRLIELAGGCIQRKDRKVLAFLLKKLLLSISANFPLQVSGFVAIFRVCGV